jgi:hypothetical protein
VAKGETRAFYRYSTRFRLILTQWLGLKVVTGRFIGAGPTAAADASVFTISALILELAEVTQFLKMLGVSPYLCE